MTIQALSTHLDDQTANLVDRLRLLLSEIANRTKQADEIKKELRLIGPGTFHYNGRPILDLTAGSTFDPAKAEKILTAEQLEACKETVISAKRAAQVLPPALYAMCRKPGTTAVKPL